MADESPSFIRRWSQRKLAAAREAQPKAPAVEPQPLAVAAVPVETAAVEAPIASELPPVESLTFESDFAAFLKPGVDAALRGQALKKLFADPRFNVMDGLDVYIDDYGKTVPIPPELVKELRHARFLFDPPQTRVNADGHVEDVPDEPDTEPAAEAQPIADEGPDAANDAQAADPAPHTDER